MTKSTI